MLRRTIFASTLQAQIKGKNMLLRMPSTKMVKQAFYPIIIFFLEVKALQAWESPDK